MSLNGLLVIFSGHVLGMYITKFSFKVFFACIKFYFILCLYYHGQHHKNKKQTVNISIKFSSTRIDWYSCLSLFFAKKEKNIRLQLIFTIDLIPWM